MDKLTKKTFSLGINQISMNFGLEKKYPAGGDELKNYLVFMFAELSFEEITDEHFVRAVRGIINKEEKLFSLPSKVQFLKYCTWELETPRKKREIEDRKRGLFLEQKKKWDFELAASSDKTEEIIKKITQNLTTN